MIGILLHDFNQNNRIIWFCKQKLKSDFDLINLISGNYTITSLAD